MIPGDGGGAGRMPIDHGLPEGGDGAAPLPASAAHHGFTRVLVDGRPGHAAWTAALGWAARAAGLAGSTSRARGQPADVHGGRIVKPIPGIQLLAGLCPRLVSTASAGAGLPMWCRGRLSPLPACFRARRTVSSETRILVLSARASTGRWRVRSKNGSPKLRGRRRTAASHAVRWAAVISEGRPGRGASCQPSRPSARERFSRGRTVASRPRTMAAIWGTCSPCATARKPICARSRSRGSLGVR